MAFVLADRAQETTVTTGTSSYDLGGAVEGHQPFSAVLANGDSTYYCATDNVDWEIGVGTYTSASNSLSRDSVLASSNGNNPVNWAAGGKSIFITFPANFASTLTTAVQPADLGTAASEDSTAFATSAQGTLADTAVQPGDDANTLGSGAATDGQVLTADGTGGAAWESVPPGGDQNASAVDGSAASPAFAFASDSNTGIWRSTTDTINISTAGTERFELDATSMDVTVSFRGPNGSSSSPTYSFSGDPDTGMYIASAGNLSWSTNSSEEMRLDSSGNLHVDGNITAYSTTVSDARLKRGIKTIESALETVKKMRGVYYTWNAGKREGQSEPGVIAQEIQAVDSNLVTETETIRDGKLLTVSYDHIIGYLIEAVKELAEKVEDR